MMMICDKMWEVETGLHYFSRHKQTHANITLHHIVNCAEGDYCISYMFGCSSIASKLQVQSSEWLTRLLRK